MSEGENSVFVAEQVVGLGEVWLAQMHSAHWRPNDRKIFMLKFFSSCLKMGIENFQSAGGGAVAALRWPRGSRVHPTPHIVL